MPSGEKGFKKGVSGNPSGRPRSNLSSLLSKHLLGRGKGESSTREQRLVERVYWLADQGDLDAIKFIFDRLEGKVKEQVDVTTGNKPFVFTLNFSSEEKSAE